jgi:serine/threonine protein kinase
MSEAILKKFGKYFLLDRVGEGGMAEIFRARMASLDHSGRLLVIKRIMGEYSNNIEFVSMFKSEVQVTMRFSHPNVVQIFDSGEEQGQPFIAMEFIDGRNLRQILSRSSKKSQILPLAASCYIVEQAAAGLHYAHAFKDRITGEALNLVHRDVSPQNILISYDGNIKLIDFGIAKASTNGESTRAGVIKGKLSYLSPEQVLGETLDGRSDLFALGIVLWESLTGKRLFVSDSDNEFQVLKMIEGCTTFVKPPSHFNPEIPPDLDSIVMQALARDPRKRFQSGEEFSRALRRVLFTHFSEYGPSDLSQFIKQMFHDVIVEDRKNLQTVNTRAEELIKLGFKASEREKTSTDLARGPDAGGSAQKGEHTRMTQFLGDRFDQSQLNDAEKVEVAGNPSRQLKVAGAKAPASNPAAVKSGTRTMSRPQPHTRTGVVQPQPVNVPQAAGMPGAVKWVVGAAGIGAVIYFAGMKDTSKSIAPALPVETAQSQSKPFSGKTGKIKLGISPEGDRATTVVTLNSQQQSMDSGFVEAPIGEPLILVVERPGYVPYRKEFTLQESDLGTANEMPMDVSLEAMAYGLFSISTRPAVADVSIVNIDRQPAENSKPMEFKTPVHQEKLPAGNYRVTIRNELLGVEKVMNIVVKEGKEVVLTDVKLEIKN